MVRKSMKLASLFLILNTALTYAQTACREGVRERVKPGITQTALPDGEGLLVWSYALTATIAPVDKLQLSLGLANDRAQLLAFDNNLPSAPQLSGEATWLIDGTNFAAVTNHTARFAIKLPKSNTKPDLVAYRLVLKQDNSDCLLETGLISGPGVAYDPSAFRPIFGTSISLGALEASRDFEVKDGHIYLTNQSRKRPSITVGGLFHTFDFPQDKNKIFKTLDLFLTFDFTPGSTKVLDSLTVGPAFGLTKYLSLYAGWSVSNNRQLSDGFTRAAASYVKNKGDAPISR